MTGLETLSERGTASRPEIQLLLLCARTTQSPDNAERIKALLREDIDWAYLLRSADGHRVTSLVYRSLTATDPEVVPKDIMDRLHSHVQANRLRNLFLTRELLKLLGDLEAHGIPAIPYKGPVLTAFVYGNLALREFGDLDVLVHRRHISKAKQSLISLGFRPEDHLTPPEEKAFLESQREYVFTHEKNGSVVELHWAVMPRSYSFPLDPEHLWKNLGSVSLGGSTVPSFQPEELLLLLCVHGSKHFWFRLSWICDVAELIWSCGDMDWERLVEMARSLGSRRMLFLGLLLARELLSAPVPEQIVRAAQEDSKVITLVRQVRLWLFQEESEPGILARGQPEESAFHPFRIRMRERLWDKIRYCLRTALVPTPEDWRAVSLPEALFPVYYLIRPIRLTVRYGQLALGRRPASGKPS